jgi:gas vesicle protein
VSNAAGEGRDDHDGVISLLAGVGVGLVLGGMAALLLAPQPGEQTRAQIRESADDALGKLRQSMEELRVKVEDLTATARENIAHRTGAASGAPGEAAGPTDEGGPPIG